MDKFLSVLQKGMEKKGLTQTVIAKTIGVSVGTVHNYLNGQQRMGFFVFVKFAKCIFEEHEVKRLIWEFINCSPDNKKYNKLDIVREGLEWSIQNAEPELLEYFIEQDFKLTRNGELGKIYDLFRQRSIGKLSHLKLYDELETLKIQGFKKGESATLLKIASMYALYESQAHTLFFFEAEKTMKQIDLIKNKYLKKAYSIRVKEALAIAFMLRNQLTKAEEYCNEILAERDIEHFPLIVNSVYLILAQIYSFSNYRKSLEFLHKSLSILDGKNHLHQYRRIRVEATYDFIRILNNDFQNLYLTDPAEQAHYLAKQENQLSRRRAVEIIDRLEKTNGYISAFQLCYKALALRSKKLLKLSEEVFLENGDKFYVSLPRMYFRQFFKDLN